MGGNIMKKLVKIIAMSLVVAMSFSACDKPASAVDNKKEGDIAEVQATLSYPTENVELRVSWWGSDSRHEVMQEVGNLYVNKHPNVKFVPEYAAFDGWQQKILTQLSGKTESDVVQVNYNWIHSFGRGENVFYDLRNLSEFINLSNWDDEQITAMTVAGEVAAVPHGVTARANLYNKSLFSENDISYPITYDELIASGIIGKDNTPNGANNKYVVTNIGKVSTDLYIAQMLFNKTGKLMQNDGVVNYSVEEVKEVLDLYKSFEDSGAMPTFQQEDPLQNESNPVWTNGRSGSVYEWIGTVDKYLDSYKGGAAKEEIGIAPYTTEKTGDDITVFVKPSLGFAVSKNSKNPVVAADFIEFMFTDEEAIKVLGTTFGFSSNKISADVQIKEGVVDGVMKDGFELLSGYSQIVLDPYFEDENVRGARYTAIEAFRTGKSSEAAAKDYVEKQQYELTKLFK
jgi:oligogalacturonide transport system substrate-binding protein